MPAPSISKIAVHFSRLAVNNAAAGIRSALHAGNSAAASAGVSAGGATAAAAGGAGIGLGAAAASASGASAGASAAGGKTWGAYTYYQNAGQRSIANLNPGTSDSGVTRSEDDDDDVQAAPASETLQGASRPPLARRSPRSASISEAGVSTAIPAPIARSRSIAHVGLRVYQPAVLSRPSPASSTRDEVTSEALKATPLVQTASGTRYASSGLSSSSRLPNHLLGSISTSSTTPLQIATFSTATLRDAATRPDDSHHDHATSTTNASSEASRSKSTRSNFNPQRLRSLSIGSARDLHTSATALSLASETDLPKDTLSVADIVAPPSGSRHPVRRHSVSNGTIRPSQEDIQPGLRDQVKRPRQDVQRVSDASSGAPPSLADLLYRRLRSYVLKSRTLDRRDPRRPSPNAVKAAVYELLTKVPSEDLGPSHWHACLEALFAARCITSTQAAHAPQNGSNELPEVRAGDVTVLGVYQRMMQAGVPVTGRATAVVIQALCSYESKLRHAASRSSDSSAQGQAVRSQAAHNVDVELPRPVVKPEDASAEALHEAEEADHEAQELASASADEVGQDVEAGAADALADDVSVGDAQTALDEKVLESRGVLEQVDAPSSQPENVTDQEQISAILDRLLSRAVELLRTAVSKHPRELTHPLTFKPYLALLSAFADRAEPEHAEEVFKLMRHSFSTSTGMKIEPYAYKLLIQAQVRATLRLAANEGQKARRKSSSDADAGGADVRELGMDGVDQILTQYEADRAAGLVKPANQVAQSSTDRAREIAAGEDGPAAGPVATTAYDAAIRAGFQLGLPDRAIAVVERLLRAQGAEPLQQGDGVASTPLRVTTLSQVLRGLAYAGDGMGAVQWLNKAIEARAASTEPSQGKPAHPRVASDSALLAVIEELNRRILPRVRSGNVASAQLEEMVNAMASVLKIFNDGRASSKVALDPEQSVITSKATGTLNMYTDLRLGQAASEETLQKQPWNTSASSASDLSAPAPPSQSELASAQDAHVDESVPPASPTQTATSAPTVDEAMSTSTAPTSVFGAASEHTGSPNLPEVGIVDVDLGRTIGSMLQAPHRTKGKPIIIDVDGALAKVHENVAIGTYPTPDAIGALMMAFGRQGNLARVNEVYDIAVQAVRGLTGDLHWQAMAWHKLQDQRLCALAHAGELDAALECRHRIIAEGRLPSSDAYAALIANVKETTDDALVAEELFDESQRLGRRANVYLYTTVISKLSRARRVTRALELFDEMRARGLRPTTITYGAVMNACVRSGDVAGALRLFPQMEADPHFSPRPPPYNMLCQYYTYTEPDREKALSFYHKMRSHNVQPNSHTYKLLLDAYGSLDPVQPDEMLRVFKELESDPYVKPQGTHWASLIQCFGISLKDVNKAIEVFENSVRSVGPDPIAFEALLSTFFEAKRIDLVRHYVSTMQGRGLQLTAYVCNVLIKGLALEGADGLAEARKIFANMQDPPAGLAAKGNHAARSHGAGAVPQAPSATDSNAASLHDPSTTGSVAQVYKEPSTYEAMIRAELFHGNVDEAEALLERMEARAFPPALILRTRTLLDSHASEVLNAKLVSSAPASQSMAAKGDATVSASASANPPEHAAASASAQGDGESSTIAAPTPAQPSST